MPKQKVKQLRYQQGRFAHCGVIVFDGDILETGSIKPHSAEGSNKLETVQLLHRPCYEVKTWIDCEAQRLEEWLNANPW